MAHLFFAIRNAWVAALLASAITPARFALAASSGGR